MKKLVNLNLLSLLIVYISQSHDHQSSVAAASATRAHGDLSPLIIIPGFQASKLEDKLVAKSRVKHDYCKHNHGWEEGFWISNKNLQPGISDCWLDNIRLEYTSGREFAKPPAGVYVRAHPFGSIGSITYADSEIFEVYMPNLVNQLKSYGYKVDENLLAAPYDFRLTPQQFVDQNYVRLTRLIEQAQQVKGKGHKVTLLCHSSGCPNVIAYLGKQTREWRMTRIHKLVAVSPNWAGAVLAAQQLINASIINLGNISAIETRALYRTWPTMAFRLPHERLFELDSGSSTQNEEEPIVVTPRRNYTLGQVTDLLQDLKLDHQREWYEKTLGLANSQVKPLDGLQIICLHGIESPTARTLVFKNQDDFPNGQFEVVNASGDGTINLESLSLCKQWVETYPDKIQNIPVAKATHNGLLNDETLYDLLEDVTQIS